LNLAVSKTLALWKVIMKDSILLHSFMPVGFATALNDQDTTLYPTAVNDFVLKGPGFAVDGEYLSNRLS
jgi:hypothetical protein